MFCKHTLHTFLYLVLSYLLLVIPSCWYLSFMPMHTKFYVIIYIYVSLILEPITHCNLHIIREKAYLLFSKFKIDNWEWGWSQVRFLNIETLTNQFYDIGGIAAYFAVVVNKVVIYIYSNNHLQVKVRWDFNEKSTLRPIYFNKKSTSRLLSQRAPPQIFG